MFITQPILAVYFHQSHVFTQFGDQTEKSAITENGPHLTNNYIYTSVIELSSPAKLRAVAGAEGWVSSSRPDSRVSSTAESSVASAASACSLSFTLCFASCIDFPTSSAASSADSWLSSCSYVHQHGEHNTLTTLCLVLDYGTVCHNDIVASNTLSQFCCGLKTFLFSQSYPSILF